jgi:hypothetical protein
LPRPGRARRARRRGRRKKRISNKDWENASDPDATITKIKGGRTHRAHKPEHAVDLDSGALVAVSLQGADVYDTGGLRRRHLRGRQNIVKRLLVHGRRVQLRSAHAARVWARDARKDARSTSVRLHSPSASSSSASGWPPRLCGSSHG